jgi:hypothetical protein
MKLGVGRFIIGLSFLLVMAVGCVTVKRKTDTAH